MEQPIRGKLDNLFILLKINNNDNSLKHRIYSFGMISGQYFALLCWAKSADTEIIPPGPIGQISSQKFYINQLYRQEQIE